MSVMVSEEEKTKLFDSKARENEQNSIFTVCFALYLISAAFVLSTWGADTIMRVVGLAGMLLCLGIALTLIGWENTRDWSHALKQCLLVAEMYNLPLNPWQVEYISSSLLTSSIYKKFLEQAEEIQPGLISDDFFAGSGRTREAYGKVVRHLWERRQPKAAAKQPVSA